MGNMVFHLWPGRPKDTWDTAGEKYRPAATIATKIPVWTMCVGIQYCIANTFWHNSFQWINKVYSEKILACTGIRQYFKVESQFFTFIAIK